MESDKSRYHTAIAEGKAVKIGKVSGGSESENTYWTEELIGLLNPKKDSAKLHLLKYGGMDSKYSAKNLRERNTNRQAGSKTETISEGEAKDWLEENDISEGKLEDFLKAYDILQSFRN